jgi:xanthine dehydrogenase accessory factor
MSDATQILDAIVREVDAGRRAALCAVVATRGSTPQVPGALLAVNAVGKAVGTVGGGATEAAVSRRAGELLSAGSGGLFTFDLENDLGFDDRPVCGGKMDVAIQVITEPGEAQALREAVGRLRAGEAVSLPVRVRTSAGSEEYRVRIEATPKLIVAGAGHVGQAVARTVAPLGFGVTVIDDRREVLSPQRFAAPIARKVGEIAETLAAWPIDANTYVVIVTRGHQHDQQALAAVVGSPAKYVGMIGSRRKIEVVFENLSRQGVTRQQLDCVHAPIGLDIGAVTPEEIAISIAAELIAVRRADYRGVVEGPIPVAEGGA